MTIAAGRLFVLAVPLAIAGVAAFVTGVVRFGDQAADGQGSAPTAHTSAMTPASPPSEAEAGPAQAGAPSRLAAAHSEAAGLAAALGAPAPLPQRGAPAFDIARIDRSGTAVIAGTSTPGVRVDLMRGQEVIDHAMADRSGQFVMTPRALPRGEYELTLRSRQADGSDSVSKGVAVSLPAGPTVGPSAAEAAAAPASTSTAVAAIQRPIVAAPAGTDAIGSFLVVPAAAANARAAITTVERGDSLWHISRARYGSGIHYMAIVRANRGHIRNPDLIHPGQIFIVPELR